MKTLLALLLLSVAVCGAQGKSDSTKWYFSKHLYAIDDTSGLIKIDPFQDTRLKQFSLCFVYSWDIYIKENPVKPFQKKIHHPGSFDKACQYNRVCIVPEHWWIEWVYPDYPNMQGFVEFLRRKTK